MIAACVPRKEIGTRAEARNLEVERALRMDADYILFLDSDQTMPDDAVELMVGLDADVSVIDTPPHDSDMHNVKYNPDGSVCYCTIACSLIKARVFKSLPKPWFSSAYDFVQDGFQEGKIIMKRLDKAEDNNVGEDIYFVRSAIEAGFSVKILLDPRCNHFRL